MDWIYWQCTLGECSPLSDIIVYQKDILVDSFAYLGSHFHITKEKPKLEKLPILFASTRRFIWPTGVTSFSAITIPSEPRRGKGKQEKQKGEMKMKKYRKSMLRKYTFPNLPKVFQLFSVFPWSVSPLVLLSICTVILLTLQVLLLHWISKPDPRKIILMGEPILNCFTIRTKKKKKNPLPSFAHRDNNVWAEKNQKSHLAIITSHFT